MTIPLHVLLLEDNPSDAELVLHELRRAGYEPRSNRVETEQDYISGLQSAPEMILSDFSMPEFDSLRALEILQKQSPDTPFIIVSGTIGEERAVQVMQLGATDYISKDRLGRLGSAVKQALARSKLKEEKLKAERMVARLAAIVETSGDAIFTQTLEGEITSWNVACETLYGYPAQEIVGQHISVLLPHGRRRAEATEDQEEIARKLTAGEYVSFETVRVRKDGCRLDVILSLSPIRDAKGIVTGASGIAQNVTSRKCSELQVSAVQGVTRILSESKSFEEAGPRVLRTIAEKMRWEVAVLWSIDRQANVLRRVHIWRSTWALTSFVNALSEKSELEPDNSVAGRTWSTGLPVCEAGLLLDSEPLDARAATREGLRGGFGLRQGSVMIGLVEFYDPELRELDKSLLTAFDNIANQISDFCERRYVESALQASEEQFRQLANAMPQIVWTSRSDGTIDYFNERWYQFTECPRDESPEETWRSIVHPDDLDRTVEVWSAAVRTGLPYEIEIRLRERKTGNYLWFLIRAFGAAGPTGTITRWYGTCTDIDDQRRSLEELRISEERFRNLLIALPAAVYTTDKNGKITLFNEHAVKLWGRRPELGTDRWCGSWILQRSDGTPLPLDECPLAVVLRDGQGGSKQEIIVGRPDGTRAFVIAHPEPLRGPAGDVVGAVSMLFDLTQMKQLEEQLRQSQKMEAVGQLAAGIAHDFNNLLTIILGFSELFLLRKPADDPGRDCMAQISRAAHRAADLTRQLLAFGRRQILCPVVLELNSLVSEIDKMLLRLLGADIELVKVLQPDVGLVKVDSGQIEQIIINLVINARDAMPTGGRLTIKTSTAPLGEAQLPEHSDLKPGIYTVLTITDTGTGMDEATMLRIFEPFFTTKEFGKGTGLGLATVFGIVKQSGGFIEVDSTLAVGTTFNIFFPQIREPELSLHSNHGLVKMPGGHETVLLVEDEDGLRELTKLILESNGYHVLSFANGADAEQLSVAYSGVIHLLCTDIVMPKMSGLQLADRLARTRPTMKVLYMSGYTDDTIVRRDIQHANTNFLAKPFTPVVLSQKIRAILDIKIE